MYNLLSELTESQESIAIFVLNESMGCFQAAFVLFLKNILKDQNKFGPPQFTTHDLLIPFTIMYKT